MSVLYKAVEHNTKHWYTIYKKYTWFPFWLKVEVVAFVTDAEKQLKELLNRYQNPKVYNAD